MIRGTTMIPPECVHHLFYNIYQCFWKEKNSHNIYILEMLSPQNGYKI